VMKNGRRMFLACGQRLLLPVATISTAENRYERERRIKKARSSIDGSDASNGMAARNVTFCLWLASKRRWRIAAALT